jgi:hypothetical protein
LCRNAAASFLKKGRMPLDTQLLKDLKLAHLEVISSRAGARKPENLYQSIYREIWGIRWGTPSQQGETAIKYIKADLAKWDSPIRIRDVQPSPTQQQEAVAMLLNLGRMMLEPKERRGIAVQILGLRRCKVETWRSHDGGETGYEVDFITYFASYQLTRLGRS